MDNTTKSWLINSNMSKEVIVSDVEFRRAISILESLFIFRFTSGWFTLFVRYILKMLS
jgi:hypothetical protein